MKAGMTISIETLLDNPANRKVVKQADQRTVEKYIRMAAKQPPPPIVLDKHGLILDGAHRVAAFHQMGRPDIEAVLQDPALTKLRAEAREWSGWEKGSWE
jgi:hypothetical protein